jgi:hypothetical protein
LEEVSDLLHLVVKVYCLVVGGCAWSTGWPTKIAKSRLDELARLLPQERRPFHLQAILVAVSR